MKSHCSTCKVCQYAQKKPKTVIGRIWSWHTKWCPCWKSYQKDLALDQQDKAQQQE